jgi:uncharacterized membrane protein YidH (DUF202 family)
MQLLMPNYKNNLTFTLFMGLDSFIKITNTPKAPSINNSGSSAGKSTVSLSNKKLIGIGIILVGFIFIVIGIMTWSA